MKTRSGGCVVVAAIVVAALLAACGGGSSKGATPGSTSPPSSDALANAKVGIGVTPTEVKIGVPLVDFSCIKQYVDTLRFDQDKVYQLYIDEVNEHGGLAGRKLVAVYRTVCPIVNAPALALCTVFTEDQKVFADVGTFVDFAGDAQACVTRKHKRVLLTHVVSKQIIDSAPPGLMISPDITPERRADLVLSLLDREHILEGKTVAVLGETVTAARVHKVLEPGIKALGVKTGATAILTIQGEDTSAAQTQLDSFIERWKSEGVNALFMSGDQVSHTQFIKKVRAQIPEMLLLSDTEAFGGFAQDAVKDGLKPNPYEGAITAAGENGVDHDKGENWKKCAEIYERRTGKHAPLSSENIPLPDGKSDGTHDAINQACTDITMFVAIASRVGPDLNNENWTKTVNSFGPVPDMGVLYASLHEGKYDADDTFGLFAFDSSIGPKGDGRPITPIVDVGRS